MAWPFISSNTAAGSEAVTSKALRAKKWWLSPAFMSLSKTT
jgi:hypothetical protein